MGVSHNVPGPATWTPAAMTNIPVWLRAVQYTSAPLASRMVSVAAPAVRLLAWLTVAVVPVLRQVYWWLVEHSVTLLNCNWKSSTRLVTCGSCPGATASSLQAPTQAARPRGPGP